MRTRNPISVLFVAPPSLPGILAHREATSGMGGLISLGARAISDPALLLYPPHTLAACVAATHTDGLTPRVCDATRELTPAGAVRRVAADDADLLAVMVSHGTAHADEAFLRMLRRAAPDRRILLFGPSAHLIAPPWLAEGLADAGLAGEPEGAITDAVRQVAAGEIHGLVAAETLRPDLYQPAGRLARLDDLPFPAWDAVDWRPYEMISLLSGRGCPAGCGFCAYTVVQGDQLRIQSVERTLAEWEWLARAIAPPYILVRDIVFAHDRARSQALCEGLIRRGIRIPWACESRPEHFDDELLGLLAAVGCVTVKIGMESGDPELLTAAGRLRQGQSSAGYLAEARRVATTCARLGLRCRVFVIAGLPGETATARAATEAALRRLPPQTLIHVTPYHAHPGTRLPGPSASVTGGVSETLRHANATRPPLWRRGLALLRARTTQPENTSPPSPLLAGAGRNDGNPVDCATRPVRQTGGRAMEMLAPLAGQRAFLTGGNGFLGGHIAAALIAAGVQVRALVRPGSPLGALAALPVEVVRGDLLQPADWQAALNGCELCFHAAALYADATQADMLYAVNAGGTNALLAACAAAGVRRVIHTSTVGTVGRPAHPGALPDEETPFNLWDSASHYVRSKYLGEVIARGWDGQGLKVVVVKPTAPVGAGDGRPTATGRRILAALRGEVTSYPAGGVNHAPVRDIAAGHLLAAAAATPSPIYILGHQAGNLDHAAFLRLVAAAAGTAPLRPRSAPTAGSSQPAALIVNPARAVVELGLPQSDLAVAFAEAVGWYRKHDEHL